jgi:ribose 5-phosphate isomerase
MRYQVICVNKGPSGTHEHITFLGLGSGSTYQRRISVADAIIQLRQPYGDRYFTISPSTSREAEVIEGGCEVCAHKPYVRTTADGIKDNNLSTLSFCKI